MDGPSSQGEPRIQLTLAAIFLAVVLGGVVDLVLDRPDRLTSPHVLFELGLVLLSLGAAGYLARGWYVASAEVRGLERAVEAREAERASWREKAERALEGFGAAIETQFDQWALTPTEKEVALGLLAGRSLKRLARDTDRSERTIRQHAVSVYRKSGLSGRAELAGFFLGDLVPEPPAEPGPSRSS